MRLMTSVAAAAVAALIAVAPASAQTGMKNGSADVNTTKARCSPGDPNVLVDPKTKTYTMDTSANAQTTAAKTSGTTAGTQPNDTSKEAAAAGGASTDTGASGTAGGAMAGKSGAMTGMKSMCKSEAESMGAKMTPASKKM